MMSLLCPGETEIPSPPIVGDGMVKRNAYVSTTNEDNLEILTR